MPRESLSFLALEPGMTVVDGTLGGGGHTRLLAQAVGPTGRSATSSSTMRSNRSASGQVSWQARFPAPPVTRHVAIEFLNSWVAPG